MLFIDWNSIKYENVFITKKNYFNFPFHKPLKYSTYIRYAQYMHQLLTCRFSTFPPHREQFDFHFYFCEDFCTFTQIIRTFSVRTYLYLPKLACALSRSSSLPLCFTLSLFTHDFYNALTFCVLITARREATLTMTRTATMKMMKASAIQKKLTR